VSAPAPSTPAPPASTSRRSVVVGLVVALAQTAALGTAAEITGSVALRTQTVTNLADVAVGVFLLLGVLRGGRPADDAHPLGHGRERFFWSFVAAAGIFVGGVGAAGAETVRALLHTEPAGSYTVGYTVLAVVIALDAVALLVAVRPLARQASSRRRSPFQQLWRGTDPAVGTVVLSSAAGLLGGLVAAVGLALRELTGSAAADVAASATIALVLLVTSGLLLHTSRDLLTGRGVSAPVVEAMRAVVAAQRGVLGVPDLFAVVVGPESLVLSADVIFDDDLDVPQVEVAIVAAAAALRRRWPGVVYVYLNPVAAPGPRRRGAALTTGPTTTGPTTTAALPGTHG
jgi:cation diffusion facilitator family transporter